jgi:ribosomal protein S18 acetylase RimI-like enzyme
VTASALQFAPLTKDHDRATFASGSPALDRWFQTQAGQEERRGVARVFIATDDVGIAGFYTLSMFSVALDAVPPEVARRLPKYEDIPAALIGRLARAQRLSGMGVGERLVTHALDKILTASQTVAAFTVVVDAKDEGAAAFYERLGFIRLPKRPNRLFMLTETAEAARRLGRRPSR